MLFRKWRGLLLDDPVEPLRDYWVKVQVAFPEPIPVADAASDQPAYAVGYLRLLGIRSVPLELQSFIASAIQDGTVMWDRTEWYSIRLKDLERDIRKRIVPIEAAGVWYQSGRILFPKWSDDEDEQ